MNADTNNFWRHVVGTKVSSETSVDVLRAALDNFPRTENLRQWAQMQCELGKALYQAGMKEFRAWSDGKKNSNEGRNEKEIARHQMAALGFIDDSSDAFCQAVFAYSELGLTHEQLVSRKCLNLACIALQQLQPMDSDALQMKRILDRAGRVIGVNVNALVDEHIPPVKTVRGQERQASGDALAYLNSPLDQKLLKGCKPYTKSVTQVEGKDQAISR